MSEFALSRAKRPADTSQRDRPPVLSAVLAGVLIVAAIVSAVIFARTADPADDQLAADVVVLQARGPNLPDAGDARRARGLPLPDFARLGWRAAGRRVDRVAGRTILTVYQDHLSGQIAFSVLSGQPLLPPQDATPVRRSGILLHRLPSIDRTALTWRRRGRTVVMSAAGVSQGELVELAVQFTPAAER